MSAGGNIPALSERWSETPERLTATFVLPSFRDALGFMHDCADAIDALDHHPDWTNSHRRVHVVLTTHSAGNRVTELDRRLAVALDEVYAKRVEKR